MRNKMLMVSTAALLAVASVRADEAGDLLADSVIFLRAHGTDLAGWPAEDRAFADAAERFYLTELRSASTAEEFVEFRDWKFRHIFLPPFLRAPVHEAYARAVARFRGEAGYSDLSDALRVGASHLNLLAHEVGIDKACAQVMAYGFDEEFMREARTQAEYYLLFNKEIMMKFKQGEVGWTAKELSALSSLSFFNQELKDYLTEHYARELEADPVNGELWGLLARHVGAHKALTGMDLEARLLQMWAAMISEDSPHQRTVAGLESRNRYQARFAESLRGQGYLTPSAPPATAEGGPPETSVDSEKEPSAAPDTGQERHRSPIRPWWWALAAALGVGAAAVVWNRKIK